MQYILTEDEFMDLKNKADNYTDLDKLQEFCTRVANEMPIHFWELEEAMCWGCIRNIDEDAHMGYCDECPSKEICPFTAKRWSK